MPELHLPRPQKYDPARALEIDVRLFELDGARVEQRRQRTREPRQRSAQVASERSRAEITKENRARFIGREWTQLSSRVEAIATKIVELSVVVIHG